MFRSYAFLIAFLFTILSVPATAQECRPPTIVANNNSSNLFTAEQEMVLGNLTLQSMAGDIRIVKDEKLQTFLEAIGQRLVKNLPQTGLKFTFHIIDIPEANAFNIPGGHVMVSRKLVGFAVSEDELAGVIAHELGHAVVHHAANDISEDLRKVLNVTALGGPKDVEEQFNRLIENYRTKKISRKRSHENDQQLEADKLGLFAMTAAGYDPAAFTSFFDRLVEAEGKTGSWFSDLFGNTRPEEKRLREMIKASSQMPSGCRETRTAGNSNEWLKWQADVVSYRYTGLKEELPGLVFKRELTPKLRSDVKNLAFSSNGQYLLAQDDFSIVVMRREPLEVLFQIRVEDAGNANFTPDNKEVVFVTDDLRYERWNVESRSPVAIRELVVRSDCWEHKLSPDGNYVACVDTRLNINLIETRTGKKIWEKKEFYQLTGSEYFFWLASGRNESADDSSFFRIEFSPDSQYVIYSRSNRFRYQVRIDVMVVQGSENTALALDTKALKPVDIGGDLKKLTARPFIFLDSARILAIPSNDIENNGIFAFPGGKRLEKFALFAESIEATSSPNYVIVKPLAQSKMGVFDMRTKTLASGFDKQDAAMWNNIVAFESASGKIMMREVKYNESEKKFDAKDVGTIEIPVGPLGGLQAAGVSDNFDWLLVSARTRGGLWNLKTGERKLHVRGFRNGIIDNTGAAVSEFEKLDATPHSLVLMNPANNVVQPIRELDQYGARQYGRFVLTRTSLKPPEKESKKTDEMNSRDLERERERTARARLGREVRWELKDFVTDKVVWSRDFQGYAPAYSVDRYSGRLIIYWYLAAEDSKAALKSRPELAAKAAALGDKTGDWMIEVFDAYNQKEIGALLVETGKRSFNVGAGLSEADWLMLYDSEGRVLAYSLKTGQLVHRFFGRNAAMNPSREQVAVETFPGEISIFDLKSGEFRGKVMIDDESAFIQFNLEGNRMMVLSESQNAYVFEVDKITAAKKPS